MIVTAETGKNGTPVRQTGNAAGWLTLAASPSFALMAWITAAGAPPDSICSAAPQILPIDPMAWMYVLMSIFHVVPWLKLVSRRPATVQPRHNPN